MMYGAEMKKETVVALYRLSLYNLQNVLALIIKADHSKGVGGWGLYQMVRCMNSLGHLAIGCNV